MVTRRVTAPLTLAALLALGAATSPASAAGCDGREHCVEVPKFTARLSDFRAIEQSGRRLLIATVTFENRTSAPLTLGYVAGSGTALDELGNAYGISGRNGVRGIGQVSSDNLDTRFTLEPAERADARFELDWNAQDQLAGVQFKLEMALREIDALPGNQVRAGREHLVSFADVRDGLLPAAAPAVAAAGQAAPPAAPTDPCEGLSACQVVGPVAADVTGIATSRRSADFFVQLRVRMRNHSPEPVILAYQTGSGTLTDGDGLRYKVASDKDVSGIGIVGRGKADPQFALQPGESRTVTLSYQYHRYAGYPEPASTTFSPDFVIEQLELLPSRQIRTLREHVVSFSNLTARPAAPTAVTGAGDAADALKKLGDLFRRNK